MTEALTTLFEGHDIRVLESEGDIWIPLKDLADAWGLRPNTLYQIIARNGKKFKNRVSDVHVTCTSSDESWHKSVNEQGLYVLLGAVNTDRLKNAEAAAAIDRFQYWIPELIQKYRKKEIAQAGPVLPDIKAKLNQARELAEVCRVDPHTFEAAVLRENGLPGLADALPTSPTPVVVQHGDPGWFNPSQLVAKCNDPLLTAERLNWYLKNHDFQYRDGYIWRLTPRGMEHGKEYLYTAPSQHQEIRISWRESVLYASGLKRQLLEDQTHLPQKATTGA